MIKLWAVMALNKLTRIDDPVEPSYAAWTEEGENMLGEVAIAALSPIYEPAHLIHALKEMFSGKGRHDRALYLLNAFRLKVTHMESRVEKLEEKVQSPQFKEALYLAIEEAARTLNKEKIDRFAATLANALKPGEQIRELLGPLPA